MNSHVCFYVDTQLFYLCVEAYLGSSPKDARSLAPQICSHFLDHDAVSISTITIQQIQMLILFCMTVNF